MIRSHRMAPRNMGRAAGIALLAGACTAANADFGDDFFKIAGDDTDSGDTFGIDVAIDSGIAIVGALNDDPVFNNSGSAYLFDADSGEQLFKLVPEGFPPHGGGGFFGKGVAIDGGTAVVGAWRDENLAGAVYLFDTTTGQ